MQEIKVKNKEILSLLKEVEWFYKNRKDVENILPVCHEDRDKKEHFLSEDHLKYIIKSKDDHEGFPDSMLCYNLKDKGYNTNLQAGKEKALPLEWLSKWQEIDKKMTTALSVKRSAAANVYPPGGYISWHNNANATGFNLIFSWSEKGDGWFDYIEDNGKGKRVRCKDNTKEWVCRYGMFGSYDQQQYPLVYHAASSEDSWRITVAWVFDTSEISAGIQEFIIDELTQE